MKHSSAKAPGKLYIAGEYAVVEPGHPAILIAVDKFLTVHINESNALGTIQSKNYSNKPFSWKRGKNQNLVMEQDNNPFSYLVEAIHIAEQYVIEHGRTLTYFDLNIESDLDHESGAKLGLGSSAAVTVAAIKALLNFYDITYTPNLIYKLSSLAHLTIKSNGSFGDLAAASYTGWIAYSCFDREWIREKSTTLSVSEMVRSDWPKLTIEKLNPPTDLKLLIGWTGSPASTTNLVDKVQQSQKNDNFTYNQFLSESKDCVYQLINAFKQNDAVSVKTYIQKNRTLLKQMGEHSNVLIETPILTQLCEIAERYGGAAKSSGAGGGDCGIALLNQESDEQIIIQQWEEANIVPLSLSVFLENEFLT